MGTTEFGHAIEPKWGSHKVEGYLCIGSDATKGGKVISPSDKDLAFLTPLACVEVCTGIAQVRMLEMPIPRNTTSRGPRRPNLAKE